jgi:LysM repeat protein
MVAVSALVLWGVVARTSSGAGHKQVYVVKPHDTLWSIAANSYGGDPRAGIWRIEKANHLAGATIVPGEKLVVPG